MESSNQNPAPILYSTIAGAMVALRSAPDEHAPHIGAVDGADFLDLLDVQAGYSRVRVVGSDPVREGWVYGPALIALPG